MPFTQLHIYSKVLRQEQQIWAILPDLKAFDAPDKKFRTLWLMPSGSCDFTDWERHSDIENMAKARDLVVIVPGLYKSTGTNMAMGPHYAEFVAKELPEILRLMFKFMSDRREDNFISGFSNGGFACFYIAMNYPECYGAVGGLAAGDKCDANWTNRPWTQRVPQYGEGDFSQTMYSYKFAAKHWVDEGKSVPRVFHAYGELDPWRTDNELARDFFLSYKNQGDPFCYEWLMVPGEGHNFRMCEKGLEAFFDYLKLPVIDPRTREVVRAFS